MSSKTIIPGTFAVLALLGRWTSATAAPSPPPYFLTIQLDIRADQAPDHICLVSSFQHPEWNTKQTDETIGPDDASLPLTLIDPIAVPPAAKVDAGDAPDRTTWQFDATSQAKLDASPGAWQARPHIKAALAAMVFDARTAITCTNPGEACRPFFEILPYVANTARGKDPLHIVCRSNARPTHRADKRVLVIFLNTHSGVHPLARTIMLDGNVVTVRLEGSIPASEVFIASVLGGHYFPGETATSFDRRVVLTPTPRCHETNIELADYDARSEQTLAVKVTEGAVPLLTCHVQVIDGYAKVSLPERSATDPKIVELAGPTSGLRFTATWSDRVPPPTLRGTLRGISLYWVRHCFYLPREDCPSAHLVDSGLDCAGVKDRDGCSYACDAENANIPIHIPEIVLFTRALTHDTWMGRVSFSGARLDAYVDPRDRKIVIETPRQERHGFLSLFNPGLDKIDLLFPKGRNVTLPFEAGMSKIVDAPGMECQEDVVYRYIGETLFQSAVQSVKDGAFALESPGELISSPDLHLFLGVGLETVDNQRIGLDHVLLNVGVDMPFSRWNSWWLVDGLFDVMAGQRGYYLQGSGGDRSLHDTRWGRILLGVAPGINGPLFRISGGIEAGMSFGVIDDHSLSPRIAFALVVRSRVKISHNVDLFVAGHWSLGEQALTLDADHHVIGTQPRSSSDTEVGLEWSLPGSVFDDNARRRRNGLAQ